MHYTILYIYRCEVSHQLYAGTDQGQQDEAEDLVVEWDGRNMLEWTSQQ